MTKSLRDCARLLEDQDLMKMLTEAESVLTDVDSIDVPFVNVVPSTRRQEESIATSQRASSARPNKPQIPPASKSSGPWRTREVESHLRNVSKAFQNGDFDEAVAELKVAIQVAPRDAWPLRERLPLMESRKKVDDYIEAIHRKQHQLLCNCDDCRLAGRSLYRSAICQGFGVSPLSDSSVRNLDDLRSVFAYRWRGDSERDVFSKIWQKFKDNPKEAIWAPTFAVLIMEYLEDCSPDYLDQVDVVVCVPPDPNRMAERGGDPVDLLGSFLSKLICVPVMKGLLKKDARESLRNKGGQERAIMAREMFTFIGDQRLQDLTVLLIDDVVTTGSTMQNCARLLRNQGGAKQVIGLSLFRAESSCKAAQLEEALEAADFDDDDDWD